MEKHELWLVALAESMSRVGHFALILEEPLSRRRIPLIIGSHEAQAIAISLEKMRPARPLTHDLFQTTLQALHATLTEVVLTRFESDIFYAELVLTDHASQRLAIDARPSDAIALAVRFGCPIFATSEVLAAAAYAINERSRDKKGSYQEYSLEELETLLQSIIQKEDYESAVRLRDAIERRRRQQ
jgi:bifunctional DNase/RNase